MAEHWQRSSDGPPIIEYTLNIFTSSKKRILPLIKTLAKTPLDIHKST